MQLALTIVALSSVLLLFAGVEGASEARRLDSSAASIVREKRHLLLAKKAAIIAGKKALLLGVLGAKALLPLGAAAGAGLLTGALQSYGGGGGGGNRYGYDYWRHLPYKSRAGWTNGAARDYGEAGYYYSASRFNRCASLYGK